MPLGHPELQFARTAVVDAKPISLQTLTAIREIQLPEIVSGPWPGGTGAKALQITYWVFHGCDGAGVMDDCAGFQWYVEQIGTTAYPTWPLPVPETKDDTHRICNYDWNQCIFQHPGTERTYNYMVQGWHAGYGPVE